MFVPSFTFFFLKMSVTVWIRILSLEARGLCIRYGSSLKPPEVTRVFGFNFGVNSIRFEVGGDVVALIPTTVVWVFCRRAGTCASPRWCCEGHDEVVVRC